MTDQREPLEVRIYKMGFGIRRSVLYHKQRRNFLRVARRIIVCLYFLSAFLMGALHQQFSEWIWIMAGFICFLGAIDNGFDLSDLASQHDSLLRRFSELQKRMKPNLTDQELQDIREIRLDIEVDEPAAFQAVHRACHNQILRSEGRPQLQKKLSLFHRTFGHILRFHHLPA